MEKMSVTLRRTEAWILDKVFVEGQFLTVGTYFPSAEVKRESESFLFLPLPKTGGKIDDW